MESQQLDQLAAEMLDALDTARIVTTPSTRYSGFDLATSYAVGERLTALRMARGEVPVGRKIGFTNKGIWEEYGVDSPMWAHVYQHTRQHAQQGQGQLSLDNMVAPRIEPEIVLGLRGRPTSTDDEQALLDAVTWLALGFEVVDCHYAGWKFTIPDTLADFALHARMVVGTPVAVDHVDAAQLIAALRTTKIELRRNGEVAATGQGANSLGSPLLALGYLEAVLRGQPNARQLEAGETVTTGTLTVALPVAAGEEWSVSSSLLGLEPLTVQFT